MTDLTFCIDPETIENRKVRFPNDFFNYKYLLLGELHNQPDHFLFLSTPTVMQQFKENGVTRIALELPTPWEEDRTDVPLTVDELSDARKEILQNYNNTRGSITESVHHSNLGKLMMAGDRNVEVLLQLRSLAVNLLEVSVLEAGIQVIYADCLPVQEDVPAPGTGIIDAYKAIDPATWQMRTSVNYDNTIAKGVLDRTPSSEREKTVIIYGAGHLPYLRQAFVDAGETCAAVRLCSSQADFEQNTKTLYEIACKTSSAYGNNFLWLPAFAIDTGKLLRCPVKHYNLTKNPSTGRYEPPSP